VRIALAALIVLCIGLIFAPAFAKAAITASPAESYQVRGNATVDVRIIASDTDAGTLEYAFVDSDHGGTMGAFTVDGSGATATFTPGDGYAGVDNLHLTVTNTTTSEVANVTAQVNVTPVARLLSGPAVGATSLHTNDNTPTFTFDAFTGPGEGAVADATYNCRVDGIPQGTCNSGSFTTSTLSDGDHSFSVRASSATGTNDQFVTVDFKVDTIVPGDPTLDGPSGITNNTDATWNFTVPAEDDVAQCRLITEGDSDPAWEVCPGTSAEYPGLIDGQYTFEVRTRDLADNHSNVLSKSLLVDTVTDVTIDSAPNDGNLDGRPSIEFSSTEPTDHSFGCRLYESSVDPEARPEYSACESPIQLPLLDKNVEYRFDVKVTDAAGNTATESHSWLQANTAPALVEPDVTVEADNQVEIDFGGSDADSDVLTYSVNGEVTGGTLGEIDQDAGKVNFTAATDAAGIYEINYEVTDHREAGTTAGVATVRIQPGTDFVETPGSSSNNETRNVTPTWTFESASGVTTFECNLDAAGWENCDGGSYTSASELAEGPHTLEVRAVKGSLADPTPASSTITVDTSAPDVTIDDTPVSLSNVAAPTFQYSSTDATATFECKVDEGEFAACVSGDAITAVTDGEHTFTVRPVDPSGNIGAEASYTWEADLTAPALEITSGLVEGDWTNLRRPTWDFTESDLNLVADSTTCTVDSQTETTDCVGPWQPSANLNDGNHTQHITSADAAGNVGTLDVNFRVTTITPTAVVDSGPASPSGPSASFSFVSTTDLGATGKFECRISFNAGAYSAWDTCADDLTLSDLSSGSRTLQVRAVDSAGNYSTGAAVGSWTWTTIGTAPDTAITTQAINGSTAAFGFNSPANNLASFECSLDSGAWTACTSPKSYTGLAVGDHTFEVRATNQVGTTDGTPASYSWTVAAAVAPNTFIDHEPPAETSATEANFEFSSTDSSASFECRLDGGAWAACTSPKNLTGLSVAEHPFDVRATSNGKNDSTPASVTWTVKPVGKDPDEPQVCNPVPAKVSKSKAVKVAKGLRVLVKLSHARAIEGQTVTAKLMVNGKAPKGKLKKRLAKVIKGADLTSKGSVIAALKLGKPSAQFDAGEDTPSNLTVLIKRKKGKALRTSVAFKLAACQ
jgi:hypothetical protein